MSNNSDVVAEILTDLLYGLNKLLTNGNLKIQNKIYSYFIKEKKSEIIFETVHVVLGDYIKKLEIVCEMGEEDHRQFIRIPKLFERRFFKNHLKLKPMEQTLKFLKLLCEGHNQDHQNYLRS